MRRTSLGALASISENSWRLKSTRSGPFYLPRGLASIINPPIRG
jgi:hypothetical protein